MAKLSECVGSWKATLTTVPSLLVTFWQIHTPLSQHSWSAGLYSFPHRATAVTWSTQEKQTVVCRPEDPWTNLCSSIGYSCRDAVCQMFPQILYAVFFHTRTKPSHLWLLTLEHALLHLLSSLKLTCSVHSWVMDTVSWICWRFTFVSLLNGGGALTVCVYSTNGGFPVTMRGITWHLFCIKTTSATASNWKRIWADTRKDGGSEGREENREEVKGREERQKGADRAK